MIVYVVSTEWNRPHDCDGASVVEGVYASKANAEDAAVKVRDEYAGYGHTPYDTNHDVSWDFDTTVQEFKVRP